MTSYLVCQLTEAFEAEALKPSTDTAISKKVVQNIILKPIDFNISL